MGEQNVNEVIARLATRAVHTSQGTFIRLEDVPTILGSSPEEKKDPFERPPRTMEESRMQAKKYLTENKLLPQATPGLGRAIEANPQPPSRA